MSSRSKKVLIGLLLVLVAIQFVRPARNDGERTSGASFVAVMKPPVEVAAVLERSCYDCHSNRTYYPWYAQVQPVGWWLASHVRKGKAALNFTEFGNYSQRRQVNKLKGMEGSIKADAMPLPSYTWIHRNAKLDNGQKQIVLDWLAKKRDSLSNE